MENRKGIVLSSGSDGSREEDTVAVLEKHGYEVDKPKTKPVAEPAEPQREDFKSDDEFEAAQSQHEAVVKDRREMEAHWKGYQAAKEEFRSTHPDFEATMQANGAQPIHPLVMRAIVQAESPYVAYFLAKNPATLDTLHRMTPAQMFAEVANLAARLPALPSRTRFIMRRGRQASLPELPPDNPAKRASQPDSPRAAAERGDFAAWKRLRAAKSAESANKGHFLPRNSRF
jgi:hypothetical protein